MKSNSKTNGKEMKAKYKNLRQYRQHLLRHKHKKNAKNGKGLEVSSVVDDQGQGVINITVYKAEDISTVFSSSENIFNIQFVFLSSYMIHGVQTVSDLICMTFYPICLKISYKIDQLSLLLKCNQLSICQSFFSSSLFLC